MSKPILCIEDFSTIYHHNILFALHYPPPPSCRRPSTAPAICVRLRTARSACDPDMKLPSPYHSQIEEQLASAKSYAKITAKKRTHNPILLLCRINKPFRRANLRAPIHFSRESFLCYPWRRSFVIPDIHSGILWCQGARVMVYLGIRTSGHQGVQTGNLISLSYSPLTMV